MARPPDHWATFNHFVLVVVVLTFVGLAVCALLTFPLYYEDESWTYLAVFEALRGNGFTWAAFGDGHPILGTFLALVTPAFALVPAGPEAAVRIVAAGFGVLGLVGTYAGARPLAPAAGWIAPALTLATPTVFTAMRYGRTDVVALAFAIWSIAAAVHQRPLISGILFGLAVSCYPLFAWVAVPCLWFVIAGQSRRIVWFVAGSALGGSPQLLWMLVNLHDVQIVAQRYAVSSSVGGRASTGLFRSIVDETARYRAYVSNLSTWQSVASLAVTIVLGLSGLWSRARMNVAAMIIAPIVTLAVLAQNKNPYYLFLLLPFAAIAAAWAVEQLGPRLRATAMFATLVALVVSSVQYAGEAWLARHQPSAADLTEALSRELPPNATVIAPNLLAGIVRRRPDVQFFNYHALSARDGWTLPGCEQIPVVVRQRMEEDPRRPPSHGRVAYAVAPSEAWLSSYLRLIYVRSTDADARCLLGERSARRELRLCADPDAPCTLTIAPLQLP